MTDPVIITVEAPEDWEAGAQLQVFTDGGTGTVDYATALLPLKVIVVPGAFRSGGWGELPWGEFEWGNEEPGRARGGWGFDAWCESPWGEPPDLLDIEIGIAPAFGLWKFAVKVFDKEGNVQPGAPVEAPRLVSATRTEPMKSFAYSSFDQPNSQVTFSVGV